MSAIKYLVPALAVAGRVAAQSSCSAATSTVQNAGDASAIAQCQTFSGSIAIATQTTDNIAFNGLQVLEGDLIAEDATSLAQLSSSTLQSISGTFNLQGLTVLSSLNFPSLTQVDTIMWQTLPNLMGLSFTQTVQKANILNIQNTELNSLDGINLQTATQVYLANNGFLEEVSMQLGNVSQSFVVQANGRNVSLNLPNLIWANNMTVQNVSSLSIPSLAAVNGSLGFQSCFVPSINAPNLTTVGGALSINTNTGLTNISFPELTTVGGALNVENNTQLSSIDFPSLQTVRGALDFYGNFSEVSMNNLNLVQGAFNLQSSENITAACNHFQPLHGQNQVIRGTYACAGLESNPQGSGTLPDGTNSGSGNKTGSSSTSKSFASPLYVPTTTGFLGVVAAIFGLF